MRDRDERSILAPVGTGTIETYCVAYGKDAPERRAFVFGRLDGTDERFVA